MKRVALLVAIVAGWVASAALAAPPSAPPLMRAPSKVDLVPVSPDPVGNTGLVIGEAVSGAVYLWQGTQVTCLPPGGDPEAPRTLSDFASWAGMSADHTHVVAARLQGFQLVVVKLRCEDWPTPTTPMVLTLQDEPRLEFLKGPSGNQGPGMSSTPEGAPCMPMGDTVKCFGPDKQVVRTFSAQDALPYLDINPQWSLSMQTKFPTSATALTKPTETWYVDAFTFAPDGRLFALIELELYRPAENYPSSRLVRWLVEQSPDGKIRARSGAIHEGHDCQIGDGATWSAYNATQLNPLVGVKSLHYDTKGKAVLAWPVRGWDLLDNVQSDGVFGKPMLGIRLFPDALADKHLHGYLSLTNAHATTANGQNGYLLGPNLFLRPDGQMRMQVGQFLTGDPYTQYRLFDVVVDEDALDLDLDGMTAAEEALAGTSPWHIDSDGGGNPDRDEQLAGTNPLDFKDDPVRLHDTHQVTYALSSLLRWRVDGAADDPWGAKRTGGARLESEPWCEAGVCWGRSGERLLTYDKDQAWGERAQSSDASLLVLRQDDRITALHVPEGTTHPLATTAEIAALLGPQAFGFVTFPVDRQQIYLRAADDNRLVLLGDGPPRIVFDLDAVRCASGQGCPGDVDFASWRYRFEWIGYDSAVERLILSVKEFENSGGRGWLLGVHATEPPVLMVSPHEAWGAVTHDFARDFGRCHAHSFYGMGLPEWLVDTGHGDVLTDYGRRDPFFKELPSSFEIFGSMVKRVFGDTLIQGDYEVVAIPERVDPGELLVFTHDNHKAGSETGTLWHIPARGGKAKVFALPDMQVSGMNLAPDGRVCIAAHVPGHFVQVRPQPLSFGMPVLLDVDIPVGAVVDCDYGPDGRVHLLMTDPPRVLVWNGKNDKDFETRLLPADQKPFQLLVNADGTDRVLYDGGSALGMGRLQDGSIVEVDAETQRLRIHGELVGPDINAWFASLQLTNQQLSPFHWQTFRVHIAQRPDGLIAAVFYVPGGLAQGLASTVLAWDPRTGRTGEFAPLMQNDIPQALAVVPGGEARDPWTGGSIPPPLADETSPGEEGTTTPEKKAESSGGCSAGARPGASGTWVWGLAFLGWVGWFGVVRQRRGLSPGLASRHRPSC